MTLAYPLRVAIEADLGAPPVAVWPLVADTNRMNRLVGLPPVAYTPTGGPPEDRVRVATGKLGGFAVRWDERPFDWDYGRRFAVERRYHNGPLLAYRSTVTLEPTVGGTRLIHTLELAPRLGLARRLVERTARRELGHWKAAYARLDAYLRGTGPDPFRTAAEASAASGVGAALVAAGHDEALVRQLLALVLHGSELDLQQMRPLAIADHWNADRHAVLALCFAAAQYGLLEPRWSHLCPRCRGPKGGVADLAALSAEAGCQDCGVTFSGQFDRSIELSFRPRPAVRAVSDVIYCVAGPGATPHILFQDTLGAGDCREVSLPALPGTYRLRGAWDAGETYLFYAGDDGAGDRTVEVDLAAASADGALSAESTSGPTLALTLVNSGNTARRLVIESDAWSDQVLTAAYAATLAVSSPVLGGQGLPAGMALPVSLMGFLAVRVGDLQAAYEAYDPLEGHRQAEALVGGLTAAIAAARGRVVERVGDLLVAAFYDPRDAVETGLGLLELAAAGEAPAVHVGVDAGPCLAVGPGLKLVGEPVVGAVAAARAAGEGQAVVRGAIANQPDIQLWLRAEVRWESRPGPDGHVTLTQGIPTASAPRS